jgi:hypothetical protein
MLIDIFLNRYEKRTLWSSYTAIEEKLLVQGYRLVAEQLFPYWIDGKESAGAKDKWTAIHDRLSMELGLHELAPKYYSHNTTWNGKPYTQSGTWTMDHICKEFVCAKYNGTNSADVFIKERISFVELAYRMKEEELAAYNSELPSRIKQAEINAANQISRALRVPGSAVDGVRAAHKRHNEAFAESVKELNVRLERAGAPLNYHNGFIQISSDKLIQEKVEVPFWDVVSGAEWKNVDIDMKEALDRRDGGDRDPAFYAAKALESTIKIISDKYGWSTGNEKGASNYIDNLGSKRAMEFISGWERDFLKAFFSTIRNPLGHGPGSADMPELSESQTDMAIEHCMSWIKSLVQRCKQE